MKRKVEILEPELTGQERRQGYSYIKQSTEVTCGMISDALNSMNAKCWIMDVYASNNQVYRNILIKYIENNRIREIKITYNRDEPDVIRIRA